VSFDVLRRLFFCCPLPSVEQVDSIEANQLYSRGSGSGIRFLLIVLLIVLLPVPIQGNNCGDNRMGWRKFSVVVPIKNEIFTPSGTQNIAPGLILATDDTVFNSKNAISIGRSSKTCLLLPNPQGQSTSSFSQFDCIWVFNLRLSTSQPGQLMLQGGYYRNPAVAPAQDANTPAKQFVGITGGTGVFSGAYGVARIIPLSLSATPPTWGFTFYLRVPGSSNCDSCGSGC